MAYELWISPHTGIRRKGTTFNELQSIFIDRIKTNLIYEPLFSCKINDNALQVRDELLKKDFDVIGVIDEAMNLIGYILRNELGKGTIDGFLRTIELKSVITDSTPISKLFNILIDKGYIFILSGDKIDGIVTRADVNKPIVRIYLFGIISLFELHLNYWIGEYYINESWKEQLNEKRLNDANNIFNLRKGKNEELSLLECIQLCDKKTILKGIKDFLEQFGISKNHFEGLLNDIEAIRNGLAHSQNSIISNLEWSEFVKTISDAENFLFKSEKLVYEKAHTLDKV